jgi:hypothetical protein
MWDLSSVAKETLGRKRPICAIHGRIVFAAQSLSGAQEHSAPPQRQPVKTMVSWVR